MNGRIEGEDTPAGRLAAVVITALRRFPQERLWHLDYADMRDAMEPYIERELLTARMEERSMSTAGNDARKRELFNRLVLIEQQIAKLQLGAPK